jgi:photosystem II stability/assembly factor-like uncharacterized protein
MVGYLYEPGLLMTRDGGHSWKRLMGRQVEALAVVGDRVYRVAFRHAGCPGPCQPSLQRAPLGSTRWRTLIATLATPGRSGSAQIVGTGRALLVALYGSQAGPVSAQASVYRSRDAGASWQQRKDPCAGRGPRRAGEEDLIALAAGASGLFAGLCTPHSGEPHAFVVTSDDAGVTWRTAGRLPPVAFPGLLAASGRGTLAVSTGPTGGSGRFTARLLISTDAGRSWRLVAADAQRLGPLGVPAWLGFQTPALGRWLSDPFHVWATRDGGRRWLRRVLP